MSPRHDAVLFMAPWQHEQPARIAGPLQQRGDLAH